MKVLIVLCLCVLLFAGCEVAKSEPDYDARISALEESVEEIQKELDMDAYYRYTSDTIVSRLEKLEDSVFSKSFKNPYYPTSLEARVKSLEEKVLGGSSWNPSYVLEDKISKLDNRVQALEKELGISAYPWR